MALFFQGLSVLPIVRPRSAPELRSDWELGAVQWSVVFSCLRAVSSSIPAAARLASEMLLLAGGSRRGGQMLACTC